MDTGLELDTRSKLLKAAVTVFGKVGYAGASVRQIADLAGVNHGSIRYHYSSKQDLWCASVAYLFGLMEAAVHKDEAQWGAMTPRERIINVTGNYVRFNAKYPELDRILIFESLEQGERLDWLNDNYVRPFTDRAVANVALAQEQGAFPDNIPPLNLHYMNVAAAKSIFLSSTQIAKNFGVDVFEDSEIERHTRAMLSLFLRLPDAEETHDFSRMLGSPGERR